MASQFKMALALCTALAFSVGIPAFAEEGASQPAAPPAEQHMGADQSASTTDQEAKPKKMEKKKQVAKKAKKQKKQSGDES